MINPLAIEYADYWGIYQSTLEDCVQETFEACGVGAAMAEEWALYLNPKYLKKEQSII